MKTKDTLFLIILALLVLFPKISIFGKKLFDDLGYSIDETIEDLGIFHGVTFRGKNVDPYTIQYNNQYVKNFIRTYIETYYPNVYNHISIFRTKKCSTYSRHKISLAIDFTVNDPKQYTEYLLHVLKINFPKFTIYHNRTANINGFELYTNYEDNHIHLGIPYSLETMLPLITLHVDYTTGDT